MLVPFPKMVEEAKTQIQEVSTEKLAQLDPASQLLVDVREPNETASGTIEGAYCVPRGILEGNVMELASKHLGNVSADSPIYLFCRSGARSAMAALSLQQMGFTKVYSMAGGMLAWEQEKRPVVAPR